MGTLFVSCRAPIPRSTVVDKDLIFKHHGSVKANVFEIEANGSKLDLIHFSAAEVFANKSQKPHIPPTRSFGAITDGSHLMLTIPFSPTLL
jgi:hypothetical protein